jgi:hypothetical protein
MHRRSVTAVAVAFALLPASNARAAPGDFPEQPGDRINTACSTIVSQGQGLLHNSPTALAITTSLYFDACVED